MNVDEIIDKLADVNRQIAFRVKQIERCQAGVRRALKVFGRGKEVHLYEEELRIWETGFSDLKKKRAELLDQLTAMLCINVENRIEEAIITI